jgi:3-phosphoglycerate kinase
VKSLRWKNRKLIFEDDKMELALEILKLAEKRVQIHIPVDVVAADAF